VRSNGFASKSPVVQKEIRHFDEDSYGKLRSLQGRLVRGSFEFLPARGVPIPKAGKNDIRPLVVAGVETRIVQRAILDTLQGVVPLQGYFRNPTSFGGIKRGETDELAAVPAAIKAVLDSIGSGGTYVACADITAFFTRISKSAVAELIAGVVDDPELIALFRKAIHVELSNLAALREHAERFPTEDIGVAQGSALSPLLGNIILADFDHRMNDGECRCLRYIDDFIVVGPSSAAVMARLRLSKQILSGLGMALSPGKTSQQAIPVTKGFEFLGIELNNGLIRPAAKARTKFLASVRDTFDEGRKALVGYRNGQPLAKSSALLGTLKRVDSVVQGWGKHYRFCNDEQCFENLDAELGKLIGAYLGFYGHERRSAASSRVPAMLGVELLGMQERTPFLWPRPLKAAA
jgi:RNA-directed DNA polymerase